MDKEKEIEEMADLIGHNRYVRTNEQVACILFDEGYRKSDEVRKETAKEIWNDFKLQRNHFDDWEWEVVKLICRTNGVEVDE